MATMWTVELQFLKDAGVTIAPGLSNAELGRAASVVGTRFPPDLRSFLSEGLPTGRGFPNWREPESSEIRDQLDWPYEGIAFDIEQNAFWLEAWVAQPVDTQDALQVARAGVAQAPRLIPVKGHRYIPADPELAGNPVFSVYQTDIIYYGTDLARFLRCEFGQLDYVNAVREEPRRIRFWSELVSANGG